MIPGDTAAAPTTITAAKLVQEAIQPDMTHAEREEYSQRNLIDESLSSTYLPRRTPSRPPSGSGTSARWRDSSEYS